MTEIKQVHAPTDILAPYRESINASLAKLRPFSSTRTLANAMEYALLSGGKRIRPITCLACGEVFGQRTEGLMRVALAIELLHTASIIYDDLPCMDNAPSRRNRPSVHQAFSAEVAVLCAHSLVSLACHIVSRADLEAWRCRSIVADLSRAIGPHGMAAAQLDDLAGRESESGDILRIAAHKTAPLFQAAGFCGALAGGGTHEQADALAEYGLRLGFAFQLADDFTDQQSEDDPEQTINVIHEIGDCQARAVFAAQLDIAQAHAGKINNNGMLLRLTEIVRTHAP